MDVQGLSTEELIAELSAFAAEDGEAAALVADLTAMREVEDVSKQSRCTIDPMGSGIHSDDLVEVYHGSTTPALVCGYHATYWPELVGGVS